MKKELTEQALLEQLDIPDWRHMTKDKVIEFASSMQYLSPEVAKSAIQQFPQFSKMGSDIVDSLKLALIDANEKGGKSTDQAFLINMRILQSLDKQLQKPFLRKKDREKIVDAMLEVSKNSSNLDKQNKEFLIGGLKTVGAAAVSIVGMGVVALGGKIIKH